MLVFLFCKLFEYFSQTNFPIIKKKLLKNKILKMMADIYVKVGEDKNFCNYFIFVIKKLEQRYILQIHIIWK